MAVGRKPSISDTNAITVAMKRVNGIYYVIVESEEVFL